MDITTSIAGIKLKNPTILASGIMNEDAGSIKRIIDCGAGAIVTKSIGLKPRDGFSNPTFVELDHGLLNAMGLPNPGIKLFADEIKELKNANVPIIGSIYGKNPEEFIKLAKEMEKFGTSALELNLSCPHAKDFGLELGSDPSVVKDITLNVKENVNIPVFVKLSPNVTNIIDIAKAAEVGKAEGIVAINTIKAMVIDLDIKKPVLSNKIGGYSGKAIKPIAIRCVYDISKNVNIPVIGVGGITSGEDVIEFLMAGASAIQIGSSLYYRGIEVFYKVCNEIKDWMENHSINKLSEIIGVAHK
jgi:dihydroorotate dehydrogenase (NAD+) catalytic subunit